MSPLFLGAAKAVLVAQLAQATLVGTVWDAETARPVEGVVVGLTELGRTATTDATGRYVLQEVPAGLNQITVRSIGYALRSLQAFVPRDGRLEINFWLVPEPVPMQPFDVPAPVIVRAIDRIDSTSFPDREISAATLRNHPMLAEPDAFEALGGGEVVLRLESPSGVQIRGGASDQTAYLLDGIPIFNPYHAAGMSSGWNPDALSRLQVSSAAPLLAYPYALSGAIEAFTRAPRDRVHGQGSVSTSQTRFTFDGPLGKAGAGYLVSMRSGFSDAIAPREESSYVKGDTGDWLAKLEAPALGGRVLLLGYGNENDLSTAAALAAVDGTSPDPRRNNFEWYSQSMGGEWRRAFSNTIVRFLGWNSTGGAGSVWAGRDAPIDMAATRRDQGLLAGVRHRSVRATSVAEIRVEQSRTSYRISSDSTSGPSWNLRVSTPVATALAQHARSVGRRVEFNVGASVAATGGETHLGRSAQLAWHTFKQLTLSGSYARTHQFAQSLRNAESVVGNVFPVDLYMGAGASGIPVARCEQVVLAADYRPSASVRLGAQAYERRADGLLLVAPRVGEPFATSAFAVGSGLSRAVSADAVVTAARYGIIASYGLQRVRLSHGDASYVPESAATHRLEGGVIVFPGASASIRLGATAAMGRRTTAISEGFEWEACNLLDKGCEFAGSPRYDEGPLGGTPLPAYFRVDLGVRKQWRLGVGGRDASIALFGTVTNLLGRKNVLTYARNPSTGELAGITMRPRAPLVIGIDWGF